MLGVGKRKARMQQKALDDLLMPDVSEMFASGSVKKVCFENGDKDLNVGFGTAEYSSLNCRYNVEQIGSSNWWHQIIVNNDGKPRINPATVLPELYKLVDGETFTPIGLRTSKRNFYFFIRNQGKALQKLFVKGLRIYVEGQPVELIVRFCVGEFQQGMLNPRDKLAIVIRKCVQVPLLNLNTIKNHPELSDVTISLANVGCLNMLCEQLNEARKLLQPVKNLNLLNNEITNLKPFSSLRGFNISGIDLQFNKIEAIEEFQHLKHLYLQSIRVTGNPVAKTPQFKEKLIAVLPTLKMIDSMDVEAAKVSRPEPLVYDNRNEAVVSTTSMIVIIRHHDVDDTFKADFSRRKIYGDTWTKVVVEHKGRFSKQVILNEMCSQLFNSCSFYPCYYTHDKKIDTFLLYQNFNALNVLIHNNLRMNIQSLKIKFELHLNYADHIDGQLNWGHKLNFVIRKRIVGQSLNLDNLADDSDLSNIIVPTTNSFGVFNVFTAANKINNQIISMSFQGNRISKVDGFEGMKFLPQLMSLDLRNNNIESFGEMCELPQIHELFLDKNPFCVKPEFYEEPWRYIQELKKCFPKLQYLDGRRIDVNTGLVFMRNFIVSPSAYTLTESFMKFYFEIYDSTSRASLNQLYNFNSAFTMAHSLASNRANHFVSNSTNSRNTLRDNIFNGDAITMLLESFPSTQHDFSTLCIDVPFMNDVNILIVVSGYFKEMGQSLNDDDVVYAFSRTFFLERMNKKQGAVNNTFKYFIKNEQLHVRNVNAEETNKAFKKSVVGESELNEICYDLMPLQFQEEEANIIVLSGITQLKDQWCKRLLQDSNWDIKTALGYFNDLADRNIWILDDFNFVV